MKNYELVFDDVILTQLSKLRNDTHTREIVSKILDKIEELGPNAGKLIDSRLHLYEVKRMHPHIRLYFKIEEDKKEAKIFEYEIKTSQEKQQSTIDKIKKRILG